MGNSLVSAARDNDLEKVKKCCADPKVNVNHQDNEHGVTALMEASHAGHLTVVSFLVSQNADVNLTSKHGVPAIVYAATQNQWQTVQFLVAHGADPKPVNFIKKEIKFDFPKIQSAIKKGLEERASGNPAWAHQEDKPGLDTSGVAPELAAAAAAARDARGSASSGSPARPGSIIVKPNALKTTTAVLKSEVAKLKEFLSQADQMQKEIDSLTEERDALKEQLNQKASEMINLTAQLEVMKAQARGSTADEVEPPAWLKEKAQLQADNRRLQEEVYSLKEIQERFASAVVTMKQENEDLRTKLAVYAEDEEGDEEHDDISHEDN